MRIFLSWSGNSRPIAALLHDWLRQVMHPLRPWFSEEDIAKGSRSLNELDQVLEATRFGIICVTAENHSSPWMNYEAGSLAKSLSASRVTPFLTDLRPTALRGPLASLQATQANRGDVLRLLRTLNGLLREDDRLSDDTLTRSLDRWWPDFERDLHKIMPKGGQSEPPTMERVLDDLYSATRQMQRSVDDLMVGFEDLNATVRSRVPDSIGDVPHTPSASGAVRGTVRLSDRSDFRPLEQQLSDVEEFSVLGKSLTFLTITNYDVLHRYVVAGGKLRFVLVDVADLALRDVASRSLYSASNPYELPIEVRRSMENIRRLKEAAPTPDQVLLRVIPFSPSFTLAIFDRIGVSSNLTVEIYPFRVSARRRPHLDIDQSSSWFRFFVDQFDDAWTSGRDYFAESEGA